MQYAANSSKKREKWRARSRRLVRRHPEASPQGTAAGRRADFQPPAAHGPETWSVQMMLTLVRAFIASVRYNYMRIVPPYSAVVDYL